MRSSRADRTPDAGLATRPTLRTPSSPGAAPTPCWSWCAKAPGGAACSAWPSPKTRAKADDPLRAAPSGGSALDGAVEGRREIREGIRDERRERVQEEIVSLKTGGTAEDVPLSRRR